MRKHIRSRVRALATSLISAPETAPIAPSAGTRTTTSIEVNIPAIDPEATHVKVYLDSVLVDTVPVEVTATTLTGLTPYTEYDITLRAWNSAGFGPESDPLTAWTYPTVPTNLTVTERTDSTATITWTDSTGGGAASYRYRFDMDGSTTGPITSPHQFTGFDVNTTHVVEVEAVGNSTDVSGFSDPTTIQPVAPGAPTSVSVDQPADLYDVDELILDATPPGSGGTPSGYKAYVDGSLTAAATGALPLSVTGLSANTVYSLELSAYNAGGESSKVAVDVNPDEQCTRVGPVSNLVVSVRNSNQVWVTYDYPTNGAENGITFNFYYDGVLTFNPMDAGGTITDSSAPNTAYTLRIESINQAGITCGYAEVSVPAFP